MQTQSLPSKPRFRTDLVAECIEADGQRFIDVIDPDTGDAFRFYEVEYSLACAMDGDRDVGGLVQWAKEELGIEPNRTELEQVITTLDTLGYLDSGVRRPAEVEVERGVAAARPEPARPRGIDVELGMAGGAAATPTARPAATDVELGLAGGAKPTRRMDELAPDDVELGLPGAPPAPEPMPTLRRQTVPNADDDGPTHLPAARVADFDDEVSVDLSEHLSIRPSDVKEAVRASRSMKAVDVPPEMLADMEQKEAAAAKAAQEASRPSGITMEAGEPTPTPAELPKPPPPVAPAARPSDRIVAPVAAKAPVELPKEPVVVSRKKEPTKPERPTDKAAEKQPVATAKAPVEQPSGGVSGLLIALLVLVVLGAGAFLVWKYVINKPADETTQTEPGTGTATGTAAGTGTAAATGTGTGTDPGTGAAPTPPPEATLEARTETEEVKATSAGVVAFVVANDAEVQAGDPIVELQGAAALKAKLGSAKAGLIWDIETRYPREIEAATKKRDAAIAAGNQAAAKSHEAKIKERTARLDDQKAKADELRGKIEALSVEATSSGKVSPTVKKGGRIEKDQVVATIANGEQLVATFDAPGHTLQQDASVRLAAKAQPEQKANCQVADVEGSKVTVTCAPDVGIAAGTVVVLEK